MRSKFIFLFKGTGIVAGTHGVLLHPYRRFTMSREEYTRNFYTQGLGDIDACNQELEADLTELRHEQAKFQHKMQGKFATLLSEMASGKKLHTELDRLRHENTHLQTEAAALRYVHTTRVMG